ncbi:MAG: hypothetical protein KatS3mg129_0861 [Leptospiraceae bacterium]|nr:MAG: hypothetical protein KatS3mg129_0861 [Leptospiraceae bacterium]
MKFSDVFKENILNIPNLLTLLRILLLPFLLYFSYYYFHGIYYYINYVIILAILIFFTDFLDGFIARKFNLVTKFGKYFDPIADMLTILCILSLLVIIKNFPFWIFLLYIIRELGSIYIGSYLYFKKDKQAEPSFLGKLTTSFAFLLILWYYIEDFIHINAIYGAYCFSILILITFIESYFRFKQDILES